MMMGVMPFLMMTSMMRPIIGPRKRQKSRRRLATTVAAGDAE
jgi:hypothetical protein